MMVLPKPYFVSLFLLQIIFLIQIYVQHAGLSKHYFVSLFTISKLHF